MAKRELTKSDSLKRPQTNSFLYQETYTCSNGPEDCCSCLSEGLTQKRRPSDKRTGSRGKGTFRKRGCLAGFMVTHLHLWPDVGSSASDIQHTLMLLASLCMASGQDVKYSAI